ncbi:MAG TPA: prephenate dehydrogenase/arogenate dehydrogenase family protein [Polyangiaceae bacterium]|nr:prephenate dehydrogenase/arogenate dehydrogenase family protein [Polyangiaceae bacterium]
MSQPTRLLIIGFGLIGGSVALGVRKAEPRSFHVTAVDVPEVLALPEARAAADSLIEISDWTRVERALSECTLALLAAPVRVICDQVLRVLSLANVVTDCGSTKRHIVERAAKSPRAGRFVPGHPMAGLPEGGLSRASGELFVARPWIVCPERVDTDALMHVESLVETLGARLMRMSAEEHDAAVARTSHLPQLIGSALTLIGSPYASSAAGPAFERATRVAGGPESMWRDIFATNGDEIARAIQELCGELEPIGRELGADVGRTALADALLARARKQRSQS